MLQCYLKGGMQCLQVRLTPPVTVDQQAFDPLCASPDQEQQVPYFTLLMGIC
jgi:hypothetical protein